MEKDYANYIIWFDWVRKHLGKCKKCGKTNISFFFGVNSFKRYCINSACLSAGTYELYTNNCELIETGIEKGIEKGIENPNLNSTNRNLENYLNEKVT